MRQGAESRSNVRPPEEPSRYAAFISYRHVEPDRRWAKWLHSALETYRVPKKLVEQHGIPQRVGRVFRDEEELPATADLSAEIEKALQESKFLIVICSPRTPVSMWVEKEILRFRQMGRHDRILALLIEGEPGDSFPPSLRGIRRSIADKTGQNRETIEEVEPLAADVRSLRTEPRGYLARMAKLRLLACVLGCRFDDLRQREQERRARRATYAAVIAVALLLLMTSIAAFALLQRRAAIANADRATKGEAEALRNATIAEQNARKAEENARQARIRLAEGLVSQGDALALAGRVVDADAAYHAAYGRFRDEHFSPFSAETGLVSLHAAAPPALMTFHGHTEVVTTVAFSPNGRTALSGSFDKTLKLWDLSTGKEIRTFRGHTAGVDRVFITPDGRTALSRSGGDQTLKLWDLSTGAEIRTLHMDSGFFGSVAISPDGRTALSGGSAGHATLTLWDLSSGKEIRTLKGLGSCPVAFNPDGRTAVSCDNGTLKLWDLSNGQVVRTLQSRGNLVTSVAFSPDGRRLLSAGLFDGTAQLWDLSNGSEIRTLEGHAGGIVFSPDGRTALSGSDETLKLWDLSTGKGLRICHGHAGHVASFAFGPDGRMALTGSADKTLKLWDLSTAKEMGTGSGRFGVTGMSIAFSPDGRTALAGESDGTLELWDLSISRKIRTLDGHAGRVRSVAFSPDGRTGLSAGSDGTLKIWDLSSGKATRTLPVLTNKVTGIAFSANGRGALSGGIDGNLDLWDLSTGKETRAFPRQATMITCVALGSDGRTALSGTASGAIKVWDSSTGKDILTLQGHTSVFSVALSPDGHTALSGRNDLTINLWDLSTGKEIRTITGLGRYPAFNPDGRTARSIDNGTLKLWDLSTGKEFRTLQGYTQGVSGVEFSADGRAVLSSSAEGALKFWDFNRAERHVEFETTLAAAMATLQTNPGDPAALVTMGDWWAFRSKNDWAIEFLEKARAGGAAIDSLMLGRCYWELSGDLPADSTLTRGQCLAAAHREYRAALAAATDDPLRRYLNLCLDAIARDAAATPATRP